MSSVQSMVQQKLQSLPPYVKPSLTDCLRSPIKKLVDLQLHDKDFWEKIISEKMTSKAEAMTAKASLASKGNTINFMFSLLAPVVTGIMNPFLMNGNLRKLEKTDPSKMNPTLRHEKVLQETSMQIVTMILHVASFLTFAKVTTKFLNARGASYMFNEMKKLGDVTENTSLKTFKKTFAFDAAITGPIAMLAGNVGGLFNFGVLRPLLGNKLNQKLEEKGKEKAARRPTSDGLQLKQVIPPVQQQAPNRSPFLSGTFLTPPQALNMNRSFNHSVPGT